MKLLDVADWLEDGISLIALVTASSVKFSLTYLGLVQM